MTKGIYKLLIVLVMGFGASSCSEGNDDVVIDLGTEVDFTFNVNGSRRTGLLASTGASYTDEGQEKILTLVSGGIVTNSRGWGIAIIVNFENVNEFRAGQTWTEDDRITVGYTESDFESQDTDITAVSNENTTVELSITALDEQNRTLSGTFRFIAEDPFNPGGPYEITEGEFFDLVYLVE